MTGSIAGRVLGKTELRLEPPPEDLFGFISRQPNTRRIPVKSNSNRPR